MVSLDKFLWLELTSLYLKTPNAQFYTQGPKKTFLAESTRRPLVPYHKNFHDRNKVLLTSITLNKLFLGQTIMMKISGKSM